MAAQKFLDLFELKEELGKGAFSVVKRCIEISTKKSYAAKIFSVRTLNARVQLISVFKENPYNYFVFELITGGELFDEIVAREIYSEQDASWILNQLLDCIIYCHQKNIIHRDIKPENLLLGSKDKNADVKLADFGLAIECKENEEDFFGFAGTPGYISPEVVKRIPYGKKVDVWACGYCPFWDDDNTKLYELIKNAPLQFPSPEWDNVSEEAKILITKMLDKNPLSRITAKDAFDHPWIKNRTSVAKTLNKQNTILALRAFNARRKLKGAILSTIITNRFARTAITATEKLVEKPIDEINASKDLKDSKMPTIVPDEIIQLTDQFLHSCISLDSNKITYICGFTSDLCDPQMTLFDFSIGGAQINGINIFKFFCEHSQKRPVSVIMMHPNVLNLGPDAASISFVRITELIDGSNFPATMQTEETMIWQRKNGAWRLVHLHRSANSGSSRPKSFIL